MTNRFYLKVSLAAAVLLAFVSVISCEVGLGASVDTQAPTVSVTYPPANSVIRDTFTLAGACSDDKDLASVTVTLTDTDTKVLAGTYTAELAADKQSWSLALNNAVSDGTGYNGWEYPDGAYKAEIYSTDASGRTSGTTSLSFQIDNTAPLLIITSPGTTVLTDPTEYGTKFLINGTIAENNSVSSADITVYDKTHAKIGTYSSSNVSIAGGTSVLLAQYAENGTTDLNKAYDELYTAGTNAGNDNNNSASHAYYCTVTLTDSARKYTNSSSDDTTGNSTSVCYLYDTVYRTFESSSGYGLDVSALSKIINGTYDANTDKGSYSSSEQAAIRKSFLAEATDTSQESGQLAFSLNPNANPTYTVSGYSFTTSTISATASKNQTMTLLANAGRDNTPINKSVTVYIFGPYAQEGTGTGSETEFTTTLADKIYAAPDSYAENNSSELLYSKELTAANSSTNQSFEFTVPDTISTQKYYIIAASGTDTGGSRLTNGDAYYGFNVTATGISPTLSITSPDNQTVEKASSGWKMTGEARTKDDGGMAPVSPVTYSIAVTDMNSNSIGTIKGTAAYNASAETWSFDISDADSGYDTCKAEENSGHVYQYYVTVTAKGNNGTSVSMWRTIIIDTKKPVPSITSVTPTVINSTDKTCVNGTIAVNGLITEDYPSSLSTITITDGTTTFKPSAAMPGSSTSFSGYTIDTTAYKDNSTLTISLYAQDKAGNSDTASVSYLIDQSTDIPVINVTNASDSSVITGTDKITATANLFNTTSNNKLLGTISDDDRLKSVTVTAYDSSGRLIGGTDTGALTLAQAGLAANPVTLAITAGTTAETTPTPLSYTLPTHEASYRIVIHAVDTSSNAKELSATYYVGVDSGSPTFYIATQSGAYTAAETAKTVTGSASDSSGLRSIIRYADSERTKIESSWYSDGTGNGITYTAATKVWKDTIAAGIVDSTNGIKYYTATDIYGNASDVNFTYLVDAGLPSFTVTQLGQTKLSSALTGSSASVTEYAVTTSIYQIKGTVKDEGASGVKGIYFCTDTAAPSGSTSYAPLSGSDPASGWTSCTTALSSDGTMTWTANIDLSSADESKTYGVYLAAVDEAGNISTIEDNPSSKISIVPDSTAPETTIATTADVLFDTSGNSVSRSSVAFDASYYAKNDFTLTGVITETNFKSASIYITRNGIDQNAVFSKLPSSSDNYAWEYAQTASSADGRYVYTLTITDMAGNTTTRKITVTVDTEAPALAVTSPSSGESVETTAKDIRGTISDDGCGYKTISYTLKDSAEIELASDTITPPSESWKAEGVSLGSSEGTLYLTVNAVDLIGNKTADTSVKFYYDKAPPSVTETSVGVSGKTTNTSFTLSGKASDTNALAAYAPGVSGPVAVTDTVTKSDGTTVSSTVYCSVTSGNWSQTYTPGTGTGEIADGTHVFSIVAADIAGKTATITRTVTVDTNAPSIGSSSITTASAYTSGSAAWYKTAILSIKAASSDTLSASSYTGGASGVAAVYFTTDSASSDEEKNSANWISMTKGSESWTGSVSCSSGLNSISLKAVDAAGNTSYASAALSAYVDTTAPVSATLTGVSVGGTAIDSTELASLISGTSSLLVNNKKDVAFTVSPADDTGGSGIASVTYGALSGTENAGSYTVTVSAGSLSTGSVSVTCTDNTGNAASFRLFQIQVDSTAPVVKISSPSSGSTVNKTITVSGTASDSVSFKDAHLYIKTGSGDYAALNSGSALSVTDNTWTLSLDTTAYDNTEAGGTSVTLKLAAEDTAGNTAETTCALTVNQNSDRPVITLSNIKSSGTLLKTKTVYGTVTDDDGTMQGLWYTADSTLASSGAAPSVSDANGWTPITVNNGSWSAESAAADGSTTWYFYAIDEEGTAFSTKASSCLSRPYITCSDTAKQDNTDGITFAVDTTAPEIQTMYVSREATGTSTASSAYSSSSWISTNNTTYGGNYGVMYVKAVVYEQTGMDSSSPAVLSIGSLKGSLTASDASAHTYTYTIGPVDFNDHSGTSYTYQDGTESVTVTVKDAAGTTNSKSMNIVVDNTAPSVTVSYPGTATTDAATSAINMTGTSSDNAGGSGITSLRYVIPLKNTTYTSSSEGWSSSLLSSSTASWSVSFTKDNLNTYSDTSTYASSETPSGSKIYRIPVYFCTADALGNTEVDTSHYFYYNSDAGKPTTSILSPSTGTTVGGTLTIYGAATDIDGSIAEVEIQLDVNTASGDQPDFGTADYEALSGWSISDLTAAKGSDPWYIKASGTNNWKLAFDTSNMASDAQLSIRARAIDNEGNTRAWTDVITVTIDKNVPVIGSPSTLRLIQKDSSGTTVVSRDYTAGMYISCRDNDTLTWYLTGSCEDDSGLASLTLATPSGDYISFSASDTADTSYFTKTSVKQWSFEIPLTGLTSATSGHIYSLLSVTDNNSPTPNTTSQRISIYLDSTAPSMYLRSGSAASSGDTASSLNTELADKLRLVSSGTTISTDNPVVNSNSVYTFGDTVSESGSGLAYIAFYFERVGSSSSRVYCPAYDKSFTTAAARRTDLSGSSGTDGSFYINTDGIAVMYASDTSRGAEDSFTSTVIIGNYNIRKYGLIKIGGIYRKITSVDYTAGKVTFAPTASKSFTTAELVYAQVVDHVVTETPAGGTDYTTVENDDGDGMVESLTETGAWTASIFSDNIPDGPVQIHIAAIDNAGNVSHGYCTTAVANARPKLTKILLGTDLDGNGTYDYAADAAPVTSASGTATASGKTFGEFVYYPTINANSGKAQAEAVISVDLDKAFTIKKGMCILPEFTGGNGSLIYTYKGSSSPIGTPQTAVDSTYTSNAMIAKDTLAGTTVKGTTESVSKIADQISGFGGIVLSDLAGYESKKTVNGEIETALEYFAFTFWDATEETDQGTTSQWATLTFPVIVDTVDDIAPKAVITPFYWNSATDNSVYINNAVAGHIELEDDLPETFTANNTTDTELDRDPKVSGMIRVTGTAYDETRLGHIAASVGGISLNGGTAGEETTLATFSSGTTWTYANSSATLAADGWSFTVTDTSGVTQSGHSVTWELDLDTSKVSGTAALDKTITVYAYDASNNKIAPAYKVDIVPYITKVTTALSSVMKSNPTVYSRTASGHYPVSTEETAVTISGYNLTGATVTDGTSSVSDGVITLDISKSTTLNSGKLSITNNGVAALNNINNNNAKGGYTGSVSGETGDYTVYKAYYYNRQPNNANNNMLTDDLYLDVWQLNSDAAHPISGKIEQPHMKINPKTGNIGFAFVSGPLQFSMARGVRYSDTAGTIDTGYTPTSYDYWIASFDFFTSVGFTFDDNGRSWGVAAGGDINSNAADHFDLMSSQWGIGSHDSGGSYDGANIRSLEAIGQVTNSVTDFNKQRIQSPALTSTVSGTSTNLYLAYYDAMNDEIRFRAGTTSSSVTVESFGNFQNDVTARTVPAYKKTNVQIVSDSTHKAGQYVSIAADPSGTGAVVMVWYDETNRCLWYAYNTNPIVSTPKGVSNWTIAGSVFSGAGEYCQVAVDKAGHVHIAAYDPINCDLVYAYAPSYTGGFTTSVVDSYGVTGSNITLDVALDSGSKPLVNIGYYATSAVRPCYAHNVTGGTMTDGAVNDVYTGTWECSAIPISSSRRPTMQSNQYNMINVGLWKDSSGKIKNSNTTILNGAGSATTQTAGPQGSGTGYSATSYGWAMGNGTSNAVLSYAVKINSTTDHIETAQMR